MLRQWNMMNRNGNGVHKVFVSVFGSLLSGGVRLGRNGHRAHRVFVPLEDPLEADNHDI